MSSFATGPGRTVQNGNLRLTVPAEPRGQRHPVDDLFISLAVEQQRAIGIVLSGTGCNGTHGLLEIKAAAGGPNGSPSPGAE